MNLHDIPEVGDTAAVQRGLRDPVFGGWTNALARRTNNPHYPVEYKLGDADPWTLMTHSTIRYWVWIGNGQQGPRPT